VAEKSKIESVATVLGGVAAAIFIVGVFLHVRKQGLTGAVANVAGATTANTAGGGLGSLANSGLIALPSTVTASPTGSGATASNGTCSGCGNPFYGSLSTSYQAG
jgi:hypothetical protein